VPEGRMRALPRSLRGFQGLLCCRQRALSRPSGTLSHCFATGEGENWRRLACFGKIPYAIALPFRGWECIRSDIADDLSLGSIMVGLERRP
jgi:hypothetical protein